MDQSVLHIKMPKTLHIAVKVSAMKSGTSMNEFVSGLLESAVASDHQRLTEISRSLVEKPVKEVQKRSEKEIVETVKAKLYPEIKEPVTVLDAEQEFFKKPRGLTPSLSVELNKEPCPTHKNVPKYVCTKKYGAH